MLPLTNLLSASADLTSWNGLLQWALRLTVLAVLGLAVLAAWSRAAAAVRHRIAIVTLAAALLLPLASLLLPGVALRVLPAPRSTDSAPPSMASLSERKLGKPILGSGRFRETWQRQTVVTTSERQATTTSRPSPFAWPSLPPLSPALVALASLLVSLLLMARTAGSMFAARTLAQSADEVEDDHVRAAFDRARSEIALQRPVALRESAAVSVPAVYGLVNPVLLLPPGARDWSAERLRGVLLHELAHVARHDGFALLVVRLATSLFWFHPLIWSLARKARLSCEQACDDVVLARGSRATTYAEHLVAIATAARGDASLRGVASAFASRSTLERRLVAILHPRLRRGPATRAVTAGVIVAAALVVLPLASVRVAAVPHDNSEARFESGTSDPIEPPRPSAVATPSERAGRVTVELAQMRTGREWYDIAHDHYQSEDYASAGPAYLKAAAEGYRTGTAFYNAACSFALAGRRAQALDALANALESGFDLPSLMERDDDLDSIRSDPEFRRLLDRARHTDPEVAKRTAAVTRFEMLLSRRSKDDDAWHDVGISLLHLGEYKRSAAAFEAQYAIDSSTAAVYNQACAWSRAGERTRALDALERSILLGFGDAGDVSGDSDLNALHGHKRYTEVVALLRDLDLDASIMGIANVGTWRRRLPRYEAVAKAHPGIGRAWFNLGYARLAARNPEGSADATRHALALGYRMPTSMYNLACAYAQMHRPDDAIQWLERAEAQGMEVGKTAWGDRDLFPLRTDPRFRKMRDRWNSKYAAEEDEKVDKELEKRFEKQFEKHKDK